MANVRPNWMKYGEIRAILEEPDMLIETTPGLWRYKLGHSDLSVADRVGGVTATSVATVRKDLKKPIRRPTTAGPKAPALQPHDRNLAALALKQVELERDLVQLKGTYEREISELRRRLAEVETTIKLSPLSKVVSLKGGAA